MTIITPNGISGINSITSGTQNRIAFYDVNGGSNLSFLVGSASSTGTASQPLQVTGGAYVSGSVGIGTTNPFITNPIPKLQIFTSESAGAGANIVLTGGGYANFFSNLGQGNYNNIVQGGDKGIIFSNYTGTEPATPTGNFVIAPWSNATSGIRINSSGSVGIGSTNPSEVLSVVGNLNVSGIVTGGIVATTTQMSGVTTTGVSTSGNSTVTLAGTNVTINNGDFVTGSGIAPGTTVTSGGGTTRLVLSANVGLTTASNQITTYPAGKIVTSGVIGGQLCRAWVNFDGINNGKIRAAYNVSSITKTGTGNYTANFTTALGDGNYSAVVAGGNNNATAVAEGSSTYSQTSGSCGINMSNVSAVALVDRELINVAIFR